MYNVVLDGEILQQLQRISDQLVPNVPVDKAPQIQPGTLEFIQSQIAQAENEWSKEESEFRRCYRKQSLLENKVCALITRVTWAIELLIRCRFITPLQENKGTTMETLKEFMAPYEDTTSRLVKLIVSITDALQVKKIVKETNGDLFKMNRYNPFLKGLERDSYGCFRIDPSVRRDELGWLMVRRLRMNYAEHLADLCQRVDYYYWGALPQELNLLGLGALVNRNTADLLNELAEVKDRTQKEQNEMFQEVAEHYKEAEAKIKR